MGEPRIEVVEDDAVFDRVAAERIAALVRGQPSITIVPATGQTPLGAYEALAGLHRASDLPTDAVSVVQLDEYLGLEPGDRRSLFGWMERTFLSPLAIDPGRVVRLPTDGNIDDTCAAIDRTLAIDGIDLAILGLGGNGHVGFNEPPVSPDSPTRAVRLTPALLAAASIVVLVTGAQKHEIIHRALDGPLEEDVPASFLRTAAGDVTVIVDRAAWEGS
jgi:glucosamine-6-phosphate deaminase